MTAAPTTQESAPTRREWLGLAVLSIGLGLIVLDGTIVGVALPAIIGDLHLDLTDAQWVNSLYAVLLAALLLSTGNLADRWGRKRLFLAGLIVFVAGSLLAAAASTAGVLIGARAVQAIGAAFIMPSTLSTVNAVFRGRYRAAAFGVWGAVISGAAAVGPLAGGALTQWASWHWIFLVNLPLGALVFIAAIFTVPETRGEKKRPGVDVDGALLSAIGFGALVFAVIEGPDLGWWTPKSDLTVFGWVWPKDAAISAVPVAFGIAVVALVLFVIWERHREKVQRAEIRFDDVAGCLRTPVGGSSRQTIMVIEGKRVRSRLLSPREAARLMGLPDAYALPKNYNDAYHLAGDGVAVPVVRFLAEHVLEPLLAAASAVERKAA